MKQQKWHVSVGPGSKTVGKAMRDADDALDAEEASLFRSLVGTALYVGQDRPQAQGSQRQVIQTSSRWGQC